MRALAVVAGLAAMPATAQTHAGPYLAARTAAMNHDYAAAADWFRTAIGNDPRNPMLLENAVTALLSIGDFEDALPLAERMRELDVDSQVARMVIQQEAARQGDWDAVLEMYEAGLEIGPLVDGLAQAWALVGQGRMDRALTAFDEVIGTRGLRGFGLCHKALALASVGDFEAADAVFVEAFEAGGPIGRNLVLAHAQVLSQLDRPDAALERLEMLGGGAETGLDALRDRLAAGETLPWDVVADAREGLAEVYLSVAGALLSEAPESYVLLYARTALSLDPDRVEALLLTAEMLDALNRHDLAHEVYAMVPSQDPSYPMAELGRADVLRRSGETGRALEVLEQLAGAHPGLSAVQVTLGDLRRAAGDMAAAEQAYGRAIDLAGSDASWWLHYVRGIARNRMGDWSGAETDFRAALAISPDQSQVLNYLGYSLVERGEKLEEALGMIERAVESQPMNGAIVDSLGWAQFKLGRFDEAVANLERAAELEPVDPTVNDHLGDGYWAVGRLTEARFQWQRALSFDPDAGQAQRIRAKLEKGLDAVLEAEGRTSLRRVAGTN
ncbi:tetratricopeptide repeat protein [Limimaricola pyoseonensis]|nr:tetratricopeptide repeat protein [Limimaricola pyoseonensis]